MTTDEFNNELKTIGLSRKEFAAVAGIAYSTVSNWHDENRPVPSWVPAFLRYYRKAKTFDVIVDAIDAVRCDCKNKD